MSLLVPLFALTLFQAAKPVPADEAYERAKTEYQNLLKDSGRNKLRHHWLNAASRLEKVAERYPKSPLRPAVEKMAK